MLCFSEFLLESVSLSDFFANIHKIDNYEDLYGYCNHYLDKLGSGSSRVAFSLNKLDKNNTNVLKLSVNSAGIAQTKEEISVSKLHYSHFMRVYEYDPEGLWVEVEAAEPLTDQAFSSHYGIPVGSGSRFEKDSLGKLCLLLHKNPRMPASWYKDQLKERGILDQKSTKPWTELVEELINYATKHNGHVADLMVKDNWGIVTRRGKKIPVVIDFGLSNDISKSHYYKREGTQIDPKDLKAHKNQGELDLGGQDNPMSFDDKEHQEFVKHTFKDFVNKFEKIIHSEFKGVDFSIQDSAKSFKAVSDNFWISVYLNRKLDGFTVTYFSPKSSMSDPFAYAKFKKCVTVLSEKMELSDRFTQKEDKAKGSLSYKFTIEV